MGRFLIEDHRSVLKFFAAKSPYHTLIFLIPMSFIPAFFLDIDSLNITTTLALILIGFLYWSFVEYCIHRWVFHFKTNNTMIQYLLGSFHTYHHQNPHDLTVLTSGWMTALAGLFFHGSIFYLFTGLNFNHTCVLILSTMLAYFLYEIVHYKVHMKVYDKGVFKYLQDMHLTHHVQPHGNFGQTSALWDVILGTKIPFKNTSENKNMKAFIKDCSC